jgi:hypothetical protein
MNIGKYFGHPGIVPQPFLIARKIKGTVGQLNPAGWPAVPRPFSPLTLD